MKTITQRELRNRSGAIMRALDRGDAFLVTRNGVPVGELKGAARGRPADRGHGARGGAAAVHAQPGGPGRAR
jgi:antitoxin (DNA-binding transcriptional repressor) of toxin-antitoxin stability system